MRININTKYSIGDIIQKYKEKEIYKEIMCPICKGDYKAPMPSGYSTDDEYDNYLYCQCCHRGKIKMLQNTERIIDDEKYKIDDIHIIIDKNHTTIKYNITSTPEINNRQSCYISSVVEESQIAKKN